MRTIRLMILLAITIFFANPVNAQKLSKEERAKKDMQAFNKTKELINGNVFKIEIDRVFPISGVDVSRFNPRGYVHVKDSIAEGKLPFFGRAYNIPYGDGGGIEFNSSIQELEQKVINKRKKKLILYNFTVKGKDDTYQLSIQITGGNNCNISLVSNHRAQISYSGTISPIEKEK